MYTYLEDPKDIGNNIKTKKVNINERTELIMRYFVLLLRKQERIKVIIWRLTLEGVCLQDWLYDKIMSKSFKLTETTENSIVKVSTR